MGATDIKYGPGDNRISENYHYRTRADLKTENDGISSMKSLKRPINELEI